MGDFSTNWRKKQEMRCRPFADDIYRRAFGDIEIIRDSDIVLDRDFAIDVRLVLKNGMNLLGQEKFLSEKFARYKSVTIEYYQNQYTKERGDWFKIGVQIYLVGYECKSSLSPFVLLDWTNVTIMSDAGCIVWNHNVNKDGIARASFAWAAMDKFPNECVILRG